MDWQDVAGLVAKAAPVLGTALLGPAGGAVGGVAGALLASAFGVENEPAAIAQAIQADPAAALKLRQLEVENQTALVRLATENETARLAMVNDTMRAEASSEDWFVRRARPAFLWVTAFSIAVEVLIALLAVLLAPEQIGQLSLVYGALATPQGIAAAMCGVYLKKRSDDKLAAAGMTPGPGLLQQLLNRGGAG